MKTEMNNECNLSILSTVSWVATCQNAYINCFAQQASLLLLLLLFFFFFFEHDIYNEVPNKTLLREELNHVTR